LKLILKERVPELGAPGDVVEVSRGYARNFLLPRGKALEATEHNVESLRRQKGIMAARGEREQERATELAERISHLTCIIKEKAGEEGRLFGSVTSMDIAGWLQTQGVEVDRRKVELEHPLKALGEYEVAIKLYPEVQATLKVVVEKDES
jgi:large subunit ribosomal protein L9